MQLRSPGATPYFSIPNGGGTNTSQSSALGGSLNWNTTTLVSQSLSSAGSNMGLTEDWTVKPVLEPERLQLMKSLLAHVMGNYCGMSHEECRQELINFFGDDFAQTRPARWYTTTHKKPHGLFKKCCCKFGHHCGVYVCVQPNRHECLSRITVAMLDIATADSAALAIRRAGADAKVIEVEETFNVGDRTVVGKVRMSKKDYADLKAASAGKPNSENKVESIDDVERRISPMGAYPLLRPRRESGSSIESLLQLNLSQ